MKHWMNIDNEDAFLTIEIKHSGQMTAISYPNEKTAWNCEYAAGCERFDDLPYHLDSCAWEQLTERIYSDAQSFFTLNKKDAQIKRKILQTRNQHNLKQTDFTIMLALNAFLDEATT